jgi:hypothetical protein
MMPLPLTHALPPQLNRISKIAARDFLQDPTLMQMAYIEWAHACEKLAESGHLSSGGRAMVLELAEVLQVPQFGVISVPSDECPLSLP